MLGIKASAVGNAHYFSKSAVDAKCTKVKAFADAILLKMRSIFNLGSQFSGSTAYSLQHDGYGICSNIDVRNYKLEALLDVKVSLLAKQRIAEQRKKLHDLIVNTENMPPKARRRKVRETMAILAAAAGAGNCEELSTFAFFELLRLKDRDFSIESIVFDAPLDHALLVINRDYSTDIKHWQTWNPTAIIVDPWINLNYSPVEFTKIWQNNEWFIPSQQITISRKFDAEEFLAPDRPEGRISH